MAASPASTVALPVTQVLDSGAKYTPGQLHYFSSRVWSETVRDFARCGIRLQTGFKKGEVRRTASGRPFFNGLRPGTINLVLTNHIPMHWDMGRGVTGVATRYEGYELCVVALDSAHCHQIPLLSVNTCIHELLHVLLDDTSGSRPKGWEGEARELRIDWLATRLWLFHDGAVIRRASEAYVRRRR